MKKIYLLVPVLFLASCFKKEPVEQPANGFLAGTKLAKLKSKKLQEISGLESSSNNPHLLWVHNDSENKAEIYLIDEHLEIKLTCELQGVENRDWEDISVGPGPDSTKSYVYVGDIGDNEAQYQYKYIYRFEEPKWSENQDKKIVITDFDRITFQLPDERKDTETLILDSASKNLYVISKREDPVYLYELKYPYSAGDTATATKLLSLPFTKVVGGDLSADGKELLLKNYSQVFHWRSSVKKSIAELLKEPPKTIPYEIEPQGESIAWSYDSRGFYTLSEVNDDKDTYLYFYKKAIPD